MTVSKNWESRKNFRQSQENAEKIEEAHVETVKRLKLQMEELCNEEVKIMSRAGQFEKEVKNDKKVTPLVNAIKRAQWARTRRMRFGKNGQNRHFLNILRYF
jgi:hypothetical protein